MFGSSRKKLIAIGCSYTNYMHHGTYWPEFLAEHLDMEVVNLGGPGQGNGYIFSILQDVLMLNKITSYWPKRTLFNIKNEDIGLVVIMWSEFQRTDFQSTNRSSLSKCRTRKNLPMFTTEGIQMQLCVQFYYDGL